MVRVYGWEWVQTQTLFQIVYQYFLYSNQKIDEQYEKALDRYYWTMDKIKDPEPPEPKPKWCFDSEMFLEYLEENGLENLE
jgi:hypothetical protein